MRQKKAALIAMYGGSQEKGKGTIFCHEQENDNNISFLAALAISAGQIKFSRLWRLWKLIQGVAAP
jgi:hypothetical protein